MPLSFGKWLAKCRTEAGIKSQRQASLLLSTKYPHLNYYANGTIAKDETGITKNIPLERLESYSALYKLPLEKLIAEYLNARYGIDYSQKIEVKATRVEEIIPLLPLQINFPVPTCREEPGRLGPGVRLHLLQ